VDPEAYGKSLEWASRRARVVKEFINKVLRVLESKENVGYDDVKGSRAELSMVND